MRTAPSKISVAKIKNLLATLAADKPDDTADRQCTEYDWLVPKYFTAAQNQQIEVFCKAMAEQVKKNFKKYYKQPFEIEPDSFSQMFSDNVITADNEDDYCLHFSSARVYGFVEIAHKTAITWAQHLLGDSGSDRAGDPQLSSLEISLLFDVSAEIIKALATSGFAKDIKPQGCITENKIAMRFEPGLEISKADFKLTPEGADEPLKFSFSLPSEHLLSVVFGQSASPAASGDNKKIITERLEQVAVDAEAVLSREMFSLDDILSLEADDVLLLDKPIDEKIDLDINGRPLFAGELVKNQGNYAVRISNIVKP